MLTLTLREPVGANQRVTVSHAPGANPTTAGFTDEQVTVNSTNRAPVFKGTTATQGVTPRVYDRTPASLDVNAWPGTTLNFSFSDPDGDAVTITASADRGTDVVGVTAAGSTLFLQVRPVCLLRKVTPVLPPVFGTVVSVTATDPTGAVAKMRIDATTRWVGPERCPVLTSAEVTDATLTLTFNQALHSRYVPGANAFAVTVNGTETNLAETSPVSVSGAKVILTLAEPVGAGDKVRLSYASDFWNTIQSKHYNLVEDFSNLAVTNTRTPDAAPDADAPAPADGGTPSPPGADASVPQGAAPSPIASMEAPSPVTGMEMNGATLTLIFRGPLDETSVPDAADFTITVAGGASPATAAHIEGAALVLTAERPVPAGAAVSVRYEPGATPLRSADGREVDRFNFGPVTNTTRDAPAVEAVAVVSNAGDHRSYGAGDTIRIRVTFSEAVLVTGAPRLAIAMDSAMSDEWWAVYASGSGTAALTFAYEIMEPDRSTEGIAVLANTLQRNGGAIRSAATQADAQLSHRGLPHDPAHTVDWRPALSVADARARKGVDAAVTFAVTLSRAVSGAVTVDYATADGTAVAGRDYTATSGTLSFAAGERTKNIAVPVAADKPFAVAGEETFTLRLSNAAGARIADGEATGTIVPSNLLPSAWAVRFGRSVAGHVVGALEARMAGAPAGSYARLGGHRLDGSAHLRDAVARHPVPDGSLWQEARVDGKAWQEVTLDELLVGSAFQVAADDVEATGGPHLSAWGQAAAGQFDGRDGSLSLHGTVLTAALGADAAWEHVLTGVALAYSYGGGGFSHPQADGDLAGTLISVHPYVALALSDRIRFWGTAGYGFGRLDLNHDRSLSTDLSMLTGAMGARGMLVAQPHGLSLAVRSDALWLRMNTAAVEGMAASEGDANSLRLALEGSYAFAVAGDGSLTPSLEVGVRHDGGDADTGAGLEVGGGLRYAAGWGLSVEASAHGLLAHQTEDYAEWRAGGALRFDPGHQGVGLAAALIPTWGSATSGAGRLDAELGYGLAAFDGRGLLTPYVRAALVDGGERAWRLGARLDVDPSLDLSLEASRRAAEGKPAAHEVSVRASLDW